MSFKPLHNNVAIKPLDSEEKTTGGIIIPDTAKTKSMHGKVVAVGSGLRDDKGNIIPMEIKVGDTIIYGKWGETEIKVDGEELIVMKESDIIGVITK